MPTERQRRRRERLLRRAPAVPRARASSADELAHASKLDPDELVDEIEAEHAALAAYTAAAPSARERRGPRREWLSVAEAAELLGVARSTLYRRARAGTLTLERNPATQAWMVSRAELRRARRRAPNRGGRPPTLPDDLRRRIRAMRATGLTLAAIADQLNAEGVPTAQGGARWWASTVRAVLARPGASSRAGDA